MANTAFTDDQMRDTQGLVFSGYGAFPYCSYYLLQIKDPNKARSWIKRLVDEKITPGEPDKALRKQTGALNIALTAAGLSELGVNTGSFEQAFQEGMQSRSRATILGDQGKNASTAWLWGSDDKPVHILLMLFSVDEKTHSKSQKEEETAFKQGGVVLIKDLERFDTTNLNEEKGREHFGFADGVSNPLVEGFSSPTETGSGNEQAPRVIPTGEFILGYPNGYDGKVTKVPGEETLKDEEKFGFNGTYLVLRQLEQDVQTFWTFIRNEAKKQKIDQDYLAAKIVGRWKNGAVVKPDETKPPQITDADMALRNQFDFRDDYDGKGCPFGSHIRRTNPRGQGLGIEQKVENGQLTQASVETSLKVANRHRILRRGRSYGAFIENPLKENISGERGLFFICLNANIERQFEFIQHTWVNSLKFNGLYDEDDPLIGTYASANPGFKRSFTLPEDPLRRKVCDFQEFVKLRGGGYFFLPGIKALRMIGG